MAAPASAIGFGALGAALETGAFFGGAAFDVPVGLFAVAAFVAVADFAAVLDFAAVVGCFFFGADFAERADEADFEREDVGRRTLRRDEGAARFQPTALSERKEAGIARTPSGPSITASTAASARSARTSEMTVAGRRAFAAWTRLVSRITNISRSGSIHSEVPVYPV